MRITVRGQIDGRPAHVTWEGGAIIDATPVAAARVRLSVARRDRIPVPLGPDVTADLADAGTAAVTITAAFDGRARVTVDGAQVPPLAGAPTAAR